MRRVLPVVFAALASLLSAQKTVQAAEAKLLGHLESQQSSVQRVRVLLSRVRGSGSPVTIAVERLLAREDAAVLFGVARNGQSARQRGVAAVALAHAGRSYDAIAAVMADSSDRPVRHLVSRLASAGSTAPAVDALLRYLRSTVVATRVRAVVALGDLGDVSALAELRKTLRRAQQRASRQRAARAHVSFTTQTAYVSDHNPEIA